MKSFRLMGIGLACAVLAACDEKAVAPPPQQVRVVAAAETRFQPGAEITGEVRARVQTELSFRVSGRVVERKVDVGSHVHAGDVLARLNDTEQQADVSVARAALESAQAVVAQKTLAFDRAKSLLQSQAVPRAIFDDAQKELLSSQASFEAAEAALATAEDALSYTELRAVADGIVTARGIETGQVVSPAQSAFTLAHDGPRDAVFDVFEAFFLDGRPLNDVEVAPVSDPAHDVHAGIREVSPVIDGKGGTIRIKVGLQEAARWPLGTGRGQAAGLAARRNHIALYRDRLRGRPTSRVARQSPAPLGFAPQDIGRPVPPERFRRHHRRGAARPDRHRRRQIPQGRPGSRLGREVR